VTLIECLDPQPIRNIAGCLELKPGKVVFLGDPDALAETKERYRALLKDQGTEVFTESVDLRDKSRIESLLKQILGREGACVIDVTGGTEAFLLAVGAVSATWGEQLKLHTADLYGAPLTVNELIRLHGGVIHPGSCQPAMTAKASDLQPIWALSSRDPREWNRRVGILKEFESRSDNKEIIDLEISRLEKEINGFAQKEFVVRNLVDMLSRADVVEDRSSFGRIRYTYTDPLLHDCMKQEGKLLELKTLLEAREFREDGRAYFSAALMGVTIDWDGIVHQPREKQPETRNEVDVLLTRGMVPLFISCKNGTVDENELYKLNTVAEKFGSGYAKKMLIVSRLDMGSEKSNASFARRAEDMEITLVQNAADLSSVQWKQVLKEAMEKVW